MNQGFAVGIAPFCTYEEIVNHFLKSFGMYGGDDGARTRDLCRDSEPENWNLLKQCVTDGPF